MGSRNYRGSTNKVIVNTDEEHLDSINQSMTESLSSKVTQLKSLAFDLDNEAHDHLPLLDGMADDMESGSFRLGGSSGRLRNIGRTRGITGRRLTCYVGLTITMLMIVIYYLILPKAFA